MTDKVQYALRLAELGFHILPCQSNSKNPKKGFRYGVGATRDPETIKQWFAEDPAMNYGACPREKGVIIDLDIKETVNGVETWETILFEQGEDIATLTVKSPSGGFHYYFLTTVEVGNAHNFGKGVGIDVRGTGGYVVGPGCTLANGSYTIVSDEQEPSAAPDWLVRDYLRQPGSKSDKNREPAIPLDLPPNLYKAQEFLATHPPAKEGMNGNDHTYEAAQWIGDFGVSEEKCLEVMFSSGWNDKCDPPWTPEELSVLIRNAYRYAQNQPGEKADLMGMFFESQEEGVADLDALMADMLPEAIRNAPEPQSKKLKLFFANEFAGRGMRREYIIPGWLPSHGFTAINASRGTGKSAVMLDLACRMASDLPWSEHTPIQQGYTAIYLCGEDDEGLEINLNAWMNTHGRDTIDNKRLIVADGVANLMSGGEVNELVDNIIEKVGDKRKCVVFLDTWQRATVAAKQNADEDMQLCIFFAEQLAKALNGPIVIAFHPPKDGRATILGHSVIENSSTAIWHVTENGKNRIKMAVTRIKGGGRYNVRDYEFKIVTMEELDWAGNNETGLVLNCVGGTGEKTDVDAAAREDRVRRAWGEAVRGIDEWNLTQPEKSLRVSMAKNAVAVKISTLANHDAAWKEKYCKDLLNLDEKPDASRDTVAKRLESYFFHESIRTHECKLDDGTTIRIVGEAGKKRIKIIPPPTSETSEAVLAEEIPF